MRAVPQFGERRADRTYVDRPAAFGILERDGKIALVHIVKADGASWHDLPGGGVDEGETPQDVGEHYFRPRPRRLSFSACSLAGSIHQDWKSSP